MNIYRFFTYIPLSFLLISGTALAAAESPQSFTFQGRLYNAAGTSPLEEQVTLKFEIYNPSASCLLYSETQNADLTNTAGVFSLSIGSSIGAPKRTVAEDPGLSMAKVFKNDPNTVTRPNHATCSGGYTPTAGDIRLLRVTITPVSTGIPEILSPDQTINSVPHAIVAETLQGLGPSDLITKDPIYITDANIQKLFGSTGVVQDASALHHHDGRYLATGSSSAQDFGSGGFNTSGPGSVGSSSNFSNTTMSVNASADTNVGLALRANSATQSADLFQVQNSAGTKVAGITASGGLEAASSTITSTTGNQLTLKYDNSKYLTLGVDTNSVSTFTAAGTSPMFNFMGGNVGIRTASPAGALHINNDAGPDANDDVWITTYGNTASPGIFAVRARGNQTTPTTTLNNDTLFTLSMNGHNGTAIKNAVNIKAVATNDFNVSASADLTFATNGGGAAATERLRITSIGNVGVGTTAPSALLHVNKPSPTGTISSSGTAVTGSGSNFALAFSVGDQIVANGETKTVTAITNATNLTVNSAFSVNLPASTAYSRFATGTILNAGNVGIGTSAPTSLLHVNGEVKVGSSTFTPSGSDLTVTAGRHLTLQAGASGNVFLASNLSTASNHITWNLANRNLTFNGTGQFSVDTSSHVILQPTSGSNVGIGTTSPQTLLQVAGVISPSVDNTHTLGNATYRFTTVYATNGTINTSDRREKKEIKNSDLGLDFVNKLRPVSYKWNTGVDDDVHYGLIAQEAEKVLKNKNQTKTSIVSYDKKADKYGVRYSELIAPIIKAVQELYFKISDQDRKIASKADKSEVEALKAKLEAESSRANKAEKENAIIKAYLCSKDPKASFCK